MINIPSFKPMLAGKYDERKVRFPLIVQPKLDGIRACVVNGKLVSRTLKPIPNTYVRGALETSAYEGFDGELIVGDPTDPDCFRITTSAVMSESGKPNFTYWVFDRWNLHAPYLNRYHSLEGLSGWLDAHVQVLPWSQVFDLKGLYNEEARLVKLGFEGAILRNPQSPYKFGRGNATAFDLIKLKRFIDFEAEVIGYEEEQQNNNEAKTNALGRTERSTAKSGKVGKGTLGKLICRRTDGTIFGVGTGFSANERMAFWLARESLIGRIAKIKSFPVGEHEAPRFPVFLGFRDERDM